MYMFIHLILKREGGGVRGGVVDGSVRKERKLGAKSGKEDMRW